jgi:ADP-ribosylglycohydrolase
MLGAIAGDIIGSVHEGAGTKTRCFDLFHPACRFTDDSVLTVAVAHKLLHGGDYADHFHDYFHAWPDAGFGGMFFHWAATRERAPYNSFGNGAAMRVSPVGFAHDSLEAVLAEAEQSAAVSHDHPEGIRGAQATAVAILLARRGHSKPEIREVIVERFGYDLDRSLDEIRPGYRFDVSCQGSVPESIIAFLESDDYEDAIRNAISLGGDADTMACIAGGIAEAFYGGVPPEIEDRVLALLDPRLRQVVEAFRERFGN